MLLNCGIGEDSWESLDCKEITPVNPKGNQPWIFIGRTDAEAEDPVLWPPDGKSQPIRKDPDAGTDWRQEEKAATENEMFGWHHWLNGHEFEQAPGDGEGQESLVCCSPCSYKELDMTERLNSNHNFEIRKEWGKQCLLKSQFSSVQFSRSVVSDSLQPHEPQHARLRCPSPTPGVHPNPCPSSQWCCRAISSSDVPFSSCLQSFPASGSFPMSQLFASGGQSRRFSFNISSSNEHPGLISFRMDWLDLLAVQGTLKSLLQHHSLKASILRCSAFFIVQLSHPYMTTGKIIALTRRTFVGKVMSLLFNMLSRLVITCLPRSKHLLISWLQSPSAVILEPKKIVWHFFHRFPIYLPWCDGTRCHDLRFLNVEF